MQWQNKCRERKQGKLLSTIPQLETCQNKETFQQLEKQMITAQSPFKTLQEKKDPERNLVTIKSTSKQDHHTTVVILLYQEK